MEETFAELIKRCNIIQNNCDDIASEVKKEKLIEAHLCIRCLCNKIKSLEETIRYLCKQNKDLKDKVDYFYKLFDNDLR